MRDGLVPDGQGTGGFESPLPEGWQFTRCAVRLMLHFQGDSPEDFPDFRTSVFGRLVVTAGFARVELGPGLLGEVRGSSGRRFVCFCSGKLIRNITLFRPTCKFARHAVFQ